MSTSGRACTSPWTVRALQAYSMAWRVLPDAAALRRFRHRPLPPTGALALTARHATSCPHRAWAQIRNSWGAVP